jgi:hypothetical protein
MLAQIATTSTAAWRTRLDADIQRERGQNLLCLAIGILLNAATAGLILLVVWFISLLNQPPPAGVLTVAFQTSAILCTLMLAIAFFTKPDGRAETARSVFDGTTDVANVDHDNPATALGFSFAAMIALYGSFALVEAAKRLRMQWRLASADRTLMAQLLTRLEECPKGLTWSDLAQVLATPAQLRGSVAALLLYGWVTLVDGGTTIAYQSTAMRRLHRRHPLDDVFQYTP